MGLDEGSRLWYDIDMNKVYDSVEEMFDDFEREMNARSRFTKLIWWLRGTLSWEEIRYKWRKAVTWKWQRANRGWSEYDTWAFQSYLARVISEGVGHLAETVHGHPVGLCSCKDKAHTKKEDWGKCDGFEVWKSTLRQISEGFALYAEPWEYTFAEEQEVQKKVTEALELFKQNFFWLDD